ncbi:uncharacterized protein LOC119268422 isoform X3 [Triticum dicoccoides]|uniref:Uncharacterized protein n=1 Tax=Triticum urartu TaxID=4572 RepID=A0A8R7PS30_TRIUA|nr:uncharacterized protein LOC119268422 isoform X3 [Triticum dicoccoides]XP_044340587.1 uncharacterized protein LOC123061523 isoform X2 [Triticum aestivum]XP_044340588.1 uncharacterized protein LOC123061523 isoform X2 [Triticum aestivum]
MFDSSQYRISTGCGEPSTLHAEDGDYVVGGGGLRETELKRFLDLYSVRWAVSLDFGVAAAHSATLLHVLTADCTQSASTVSCAASASHYS